MARLLLVERPTTTYADGVHRVEAVIDGQPLWFTCADAPLRSTPEGWGTLLLLSATHRRRTLHIDSPVCPQWAGRLPEISELFHRWWRYTPRPPQLTTGAPAAEKSSRVGLCFSGGVDSFFSLLRYPRPIDALIHVVPSDEVRKISRFERHLRQLADARGQQAIVVKSNLRRHPIYRKPAWGRTHGSALAAIGHFLSDTLGELAMSSSYPYVYSPPWGSHHQLDPLWSSSRLGVVHFGATHWRTEKLIELADEPVLQSALNPCSKDSTRLNCGRCEKCLRTQLVLLTCGKLDKFTVFDRETPLAAQADALRRISLPGLFCVYEKFLAQGLPDDLASAIRRLLVRSRRFVFRRRCQDAVRRLLGLNTNHEQEIS